MTIPTKKLKSGFEIPIYGFGTLHMGGKREIRDPNNDDKADIQAIKNAIDLGITHIDTAELYSGGYAEIITGMAIKDYDRKKLFIVSKAQVEHLAYDDLIKAAKDSLERLDTSYLDLYLAHRYSLTVPVKETMKALNTLVDMGLVKNIGVSNYNVDELTEAQSYSKHKIVANQLHYNLKFREVEKRGLLDYCQKNDVMLIAWRPLQKGLLSQENDNIVNVLAKKYLKTPAQIALNWLISQDNVVTISRTKTKEHLKENLGAIGWKMDEEDIEKLRIDYPNQEDISDTVPLH